MGTQKRNRKSKSHINRGYLVKVSKSRKEKYAFLDSPKKRTQGHFYVLKNAPAFVFLENLGQHIFFRDLLTFSTKGEENRIEI